MNWIEYGLICALGYFLIGLISFEFVTKLNINSLAFNTTTLYMFIFCYYWIYYIIFFK